MNTLDIIILICFLPGIIRGLSKGFLEQAVSLVGMVLSVWCAFKLRGVVCEAIAPHLEMSETLLNVVAFALILIGVSVLALILAKLFTKLVELMMLGWVNRLLGALTSCLVTLVVLGVVIVLFDTVNVKFGLVNSPLLSESVLYEGIKNLANLAFPYMKQLLMLQS
ncbi:MAG: CvpA family protein [Bacteroidales bacterium]|nr:CvpA family protein [Bacteroidales bacterium]MBQ4299226.1 CvpA family protein [Bacteroidales bacterium]